MRCLLTLGRACLQLIVMLSHTATVRSASHLQAAPEESVELAVAWLRLAAAHPLSPAQYSYALAGLCASLLVCCCSRYIVPGPLSASLNADSKHVAGNAVWLAAIPSHVFRSIWPALTR